MSDEKLASTIAREIEEWIVTLDWPVGHRLGSESDLIGRYGCSRQALREAVRLLEFHGVARMRTGPRGGLFVTSPDRRNLARGVALFLDYAKVDYHQITSIRHRLEMQALEQAIDRLDAAGEARLLAVLAGDKVRPLGRPVTEADDLHTVLAELSGNPALGLFIGVLVSVSQRRTASAANRDYFHTHHEHGYEAHREIVEAVLARDKPRALAVMYRHLDAMEQAAI